MKSIFDYPIQFQQYLMLDYQLKGRLSEIDGLRNIPVVLLKFT
ncbi:MAG TPA: hypothetical protein V6D31_06035 [Candidatus Sericytochromatia bacterium]